VPEGNSRNLLTRIASNKTQVGVVHLRQLGVCMFWRRRYLSVSQVNRAARRRHLRPGVWYNYVRIAGNPVNDGLSFRNR
jgi:hypothetical protein